MIMYVPGVEMIIYIYFLSVDIYKYTNMNFLWSREQVVAG
jgi:hypothetical protein